MSCPTGSGITKLQASLLTLNTSALIMSSVLFMSLGSSASDGDKTSLKTDILKLYAAEMFFSLIAFSVLVLGIERLVELVLEVVMYIYAKKITSGFAYPANVCKHTDNSGNELLCVPSQIWEQGSKDMNKEGNEMVAKAAQTTPSSPGPSSSSLSESPAFEINKASPAMSEDLCSAATTAVDSSSF